MLHKMPTTASVKKEEAPGGQRDKVLRTQVSREVQIGSELDEYNRISIVTMIKNRRSTL